MEAPTTFRPGLLQGRGSEGQAGSGCLVSSLRSAGSETVPAQSQGTRSASVTRVVPVNRPRTSGRHRAVALRGAASHAAAVDAET